MMLWFALALMTGAAMAAIAWPLTRQARTLRSGSDLAVYRDQLEEVRRDQAAGRIGDAHDDPIGRASTHRGERRGRIAFERTERPLFA